MCIPLYMTDIKEMSSSLIFSVQGLALLIRDEATFESWMVAYVMQWEKDEKVHGTRKHSAFK